MKKKQVFLLLFSVVLTQLAGAIGALATYSAIDNWYRDLTKPNFTPPDWLFMPAWLFLYLLMGVALFLVIKSDSEKKKSALWFFGIQLALNSAWSIIFFGFQLPLIALLEIVLLWGFILLTLIKFYQINSEAGFLLIPYQLWVSFAVALNLGIWLLN